MTRRGPSRLFRDHAVLWKEAWLQLLARRRQVILLTAVLWIPWRLCVPLLDEWLGFREFAGFPLQWIADALYDPLYGATILVVLAEAYPISVRRALMRGFWIVPRMWLIGIKVALWGLAAPYLVLHLGAAFVLTMFPTYNVARGLFIATSVTAVWVIVVVVRYMLASAVMVAETQGRTWQKAQAPSTGWALWTARHLIRGHIPQAVLLMVVGQGVVSLFIALLPSGTTLSLQVLNAVGMMVTSLWWALLWRFCQSCLNGTHRSTEREETDGHQQAR